MNRNQLPTVLVVTSAAGHLIGNVIASLEHVRDPDWPAHARFHVLQAICLLTGMDLIAIALALGPLRRRDRWAFWTELTYVLFAQGGYYASLAALPKGRPRGQAEPQHGAHHSASPDGLLLAAEFLMWRKRE